MWAVQIQASSYSSLVHWDLSSNATLPDCFHSLKKQVWVLLTPPHKVGNPATFLTWGIRAACFYPPCSAVREQHVNREQRVLERRENLSSCHIIIAWPCSNQATRVGGFVGGVKCCLDTGGEADGAWLGREGTGLGTAQHAQEIQSNSQQTCWVWHTTHLSLSFSISVPLKTSPYTCYGHLLKPEYVSKRSPILWHFLDTFLNRKLQRLQ